MLNLHLLECTLKGYDHISDLLLAKYWVITGCKYYNCPKLKTIYCRPIIPPTIESNVFHDTDTNLRIYVPRASIEAYKREWSDYAAIIEPYDFK